MQSVQNVVEDRNFDVDLLGIYNTGSNPSLIMSYRTAPSLQSRSLSYKTAASGGYLLRVDHPWDIVRLQPSHPMVPLELAPRLLELEIDALSYKKVGNEYYKKREYLPAFEAYTQGLNAWGDNDDSLCRDLYRNRAIVNIYL